MQQDTKNKFAEILKAAQEAANKPKTFSTTAAPAKAEKAQPAPKPILKAITQALPVQAVVPTPAVQLSTMTSADLLNEKAEPAAETPPACTIIDYSDKAFAVIGETKPIKDKLYAAGGKFNYNLKCGAGWIFSKKRLTEVKELLAKAS